MLALGEEGRIGEIGRGERSRGEISRWVGERVQ